MNNKFANINDKWYKLYDILYKNWSYTMPINWLILGLSLVWIWAYLEQYPVHYHIDGLIMTFYFIWGTLSFAHITMIAIHRTDTKEHFRNHIFVSFGIVLYAWLMIFYFEYCVNQSYIIVYNYNTLGLSWESDWWVMPSMVTITLIYFIISVLTYFKMEEN